VYKHQADEVQRRVAHFNTRIKPLAVLNCDADRWADDDYRVFVYFGNMKHNELITDDYDNAMSYLDGMWSLLGQVVRWNHCNGSLRMESTISKEANDGAR